jgi:hypothetical protein
MELSSVVRLGPSDDNVCAKLLRNASVSYFEKLSTTDATVIDNKSGSTITISNKYFTANVLLEEIGGSALEKTKEDGVILVFDALQSNPDRSSAGGGASFDSLSFAHEKAEEKDTCGDLLRLCVGVSLTSLSPEELRGKDHEKEYSRRIMWCLDRGYEYVEADLSQEGQSKGHGDRDKEGFSRIIEAIQGTVWSSAVMNKSKTKQLKESYKEDTSALENQEEKEDEENPYEPPDPSKFAPQFQFTKDDSLTEKILNDDSNTEAGLLIEPEKVGPEEIAQLRKDMEAENMFDQMEGVLREASQIREASKSGILTDEQRRDRAGDAAMALVNLMSAFGVEDDDSAAEDSDDSEVVDD